MTNDFTMINILVPTDFSSLSKIAVQYAIKIANQLNGNVTILHVVTTSTPVRATMHEAIRQLEEEEITFAERDIEKIVKEVCKYVETDKPIRGLVVRNTDFTDALKKEPKRLRTGLIVMGTKGASGLKKTVVGSNTTSVIEVSNVPVLAVPDKAKFKGFKDIVYACDMKNPEKELKVILTYAKQFGAVVHLVHVAPNGKNVEELEEKMDKLIKKLKAKDVVTIVLVDKYVEGAIDQYLGVSKSTLLAMFTHDLNFYEKLFDRSMTRKMAFQSMVPLLALKKVN